jgi:hypothetical protein
MGMAQARHGHGTCVLTQTNYSHEQGITADPNQVGEAIKQANERAQRSAAEPFECFSAYTERSIPLQYRVAESAMDGWLHALTSARPPAYSHSPRRTCAGDPSD